MDSRDKSPQTCLSPEKEAAIKMLTSGCSVRYTALVLGVKQATITSWIARDRAFKLVLQQAASSNLDDDGGREAKPTTSVELEETEQLEEPVGK
jgi:hypothetical protein